MTKNRYIFRSITRNQDTSITEFINKNSKTLSLSEIYAVESSESFTKLQINKLCVILNAEFILGDIGKYSNIIIIAQRTAHLSPWSEKASQILISCGFAKSITIEKINLINFDKDNKLYKEFISSKNSLVDKMTQIIISHPKKIKIYLEGISKQAKPKKYTYIPLKNIDSYNKKMGLALNTFEIKFLSNIYKKVKRNPTDIEMMMFSQINSEHCRHKIFNSPLIYKQKYHKTLFQMIKDTYSNYNKGIISAYTDNCSAISSFKRQFLFVRDKVYKKKYVDSCYIIKAETHNHPTAIAPFEGAATGAGGELRDEGATGVGSVPKAGFSGFTLSNLNIKNDLKIWEKTSIPVPGRIKTPLEIIIHGPIGSARYNNEFGRPNVFGYFRTFEYQEHKNAKGIKSFGYHKPIMIAGGIGSLHKKHAYKRKLSHGDKIIVIGGPSYLIGIGGGAASSVSSGLSSEDLDYASVQRDNPEMERRCQEVINQCVYFDHLNPIKSIHDVGAGGLSNAVPEIVNESNMGADIYLEKIPLGQEGMSPLEIWCNESQERYVLVLSKSKYEAFKNICIRENCPFADIGTVTNSRMLRVFDSDSNKVVNLRMDNLLGKPPIPDIDIREIPQDKTIKHSHTKDFKKTARHILELPSVSDKSFLITIGDRSVSGLVSRDQMIGDYQVPVSNIAATLTDMNSKSGEVITMGERPIPSISNVSSSIDLSLGEIITNISCCNIKKLENIKLSANWMASSSNKDEMSKLFFGVSRLSELCKELNITIPVGKDSLSMKTSWKTGKKDFQVESPVSLVLSAFSKIEDISDIITPDLQGNGEIYLIDLSNNNQRLGGSAFEQVKSSITSDAPKIDNVNLIKKFFKLSQILVSKKIISAYHDKSDGGLFTTLTEMAFSGNKSLKIDKILSYIDSDKKLNKFFFNEELGVVVEVPKKKKNMFEKVCGKHINKSTLIHLGNSLSRKNQSIDIKSYHSISFALSDLRRSWSKLSYNIQCLRDNPKTALEEYKSKIDIHKNNTKLKFKYKSSVIRKVFKNRKPKVAIFREQGINGHKEMANAFVNSGFECHDITTNDLSDSLIGFSGLIACGGFSYGDVLGAGRGWSQKILQNNQYRDALESFFCDTTKFALGICNGCQMLSHLTDLIPGSNLWPSFSQNKSRQFEARLSRVMIKKSNSIFLRNMGGSILPLVVSHGEGKARFKNKKDVNNAIINYVDLTNKKTNSYPFNPNGSEEGATGFTNTDGRVTIMMPHPERLYHLTTYSFKPDSWKSSPWRKFFDNARAWLE